MFSRAFGGPGRDDATRVASVRIDVDHHSALNIELVNTGPWGQKMGEKPEPTHLQRAQSSMKAISSSPVLRKQALSFQGSALSILGTETTEGQAAFWGWGSGCGG
ncbi:hypothetical protein FA13DRAFT_1714381 [Coprinellus micaceus]|uniref:Uncharacterized protein n=1 Tax=Coprinellus micaceus TaxID=71717 RepID=A0A4Y7SSZ0_COPMI|nr:hypothetical protein FA13DRAFT_1714381 [Coprinellus micaceus]